jgi:hypothetical protein
MNRYKTLSTEMMTPQIAEAIRLKQRINYHCALCGRFAGYEPLCVEEWYSSGGWNEPVEYDCEYLPACKSCYEKNKGEKK